MLYKSPKRTTVPKMSNRNLMTRSDPEILAELGRRLRVHRKARGLTLEEAAERAGLSRRTVYRAETGKNPTLLTFVRLLRVCGELGSLEGVLREPEVSPMALLGRRGPTRG